MRKCDGHDAQTLWRCNVEQIQVSVQSATVHRPTKSERMEKGYKNCNLGFRKMKIDIRLQLHSAFLGCASQRLLAFMPAWVRLIYQNPAGCKELAKNRGMPARLCRLLHPPPLQNKRPSLTLMAALLQHTRLMASHVGRSSRLWRTSSSSSRLVSWPSPFSVLRLILSGDRFLANLPERQEEN